MRIAVAVVAALLTTTGLSAASEAPGAVRRPTNIPPQDLRPALHLLSKERDLQVVFRTGVVAGVKTHGAAGELTIDEALAELLAGTALTYHYLDDKTVTIVSQAQPAAPAANNAASGGDGDGAVRVARLAEEEDKSAPAAAEAGARADVAGSSKGTKPSEPKNAVLELEEVVTTGSRIVQNPGKLTRQILTITRKELADSGFTRLDEYLRQLPQNVNAANNVGAGTFNSSISFGRGKNVYAGSGINLRGLGEQYTLVLINGRRPARGGLFGDVADISTIPVEQVERIEILFDGAAALYGADAIGGVVNIITRQDYQGTQLGFTLSRPEDGGGEEMTFDAGHTFRWGKGSLTVSGQYLTRKPIDGAERGIQFAPFPVDGNGFAITGDGGLTLQPSVPGNIGTGFARFQENTVLMYVRDVDGDGRTTNQALNERLSGGVPTGTTNFFSGLPDYALREPPPGYLPVYTAQLPQSPSGAQLSLYDISENAGASLPAADASEAQILAAMRARFPLGESTYLPGQGHSLAPKDDTASVSLSFNQELSERLRASMTVGYSRAERNFSTRNNTHQRQVGSGSPVNPFGADIFVTFSDDLPQTRQLATVDTISVSGGLDFDITQNWSAQLGFGGGKGRSVSDEYDRVDTTALVTALEGYVLVPSDDGFSFAPVANGLGFSRPLLGYPDAAAYAAALTVPHLHTRTDSSSVDADLRLSGVFATLPAGAARTSILLSRLRNTTDLYSEQFSDGVFAEANLDPGVTMAARSSRGQSGVGLELSVPVLEPLLANAVARRDSYDGAEDSALTWSAGLNWTATDWLTVRFNRTYNNRLPTSVLEDAGTRLVPAAPFPILDENGQHVPFDPFNPLGSFRLAYSIVGSNPAVVPEESNGVALGFILRPFDGFDMDMNFTDSKVEGQLGIPSVRPLDYRPSQLTSQAIADNALTDVVQAGAVTIDGVTYTETSLTPGSTPVPLVDGRLVIDRREFNLGDVHSRGVDLNLRYRRSSKYGQWFITYGHQYFFKYQLTARSLCPNSSCPEDSLVGIPVDVVKETPISAGSQYSPVPEHQGRLSFSWESRGLGAHLQTTLGTKTSTYLGENSQAVVDGELVQRANIYRITTRPSTAVHFGMGYDFSGELLSVPSWMRTSRLSLQVRNLFYSKQKLSRTIVQQEFEPSEFNENSQFRPYGVDPYGRQFQLEFRTSF